jgi:hypothetical protein
MVKRTIKYLVAAGLAALFVAWQIAGAAPGDVTTMSGGTFAIISTPTGKIRATAPKTTVKITASGGIVVTGADKTINIDGSNVVSRNQPATFPRVSTAYLAATELQSPTVYTNRLDLHIPGGLSMGGYLNQNTLSLGSDPNHTTTVTPYGVTTKDNLTTYRLIAGQIGDGTGNLALTSTILTHPTDHNNPHAVTPSQLGLATVATTGSFPDLLNAPTATCIGRVSYDGLDGSVIYTGVAAPSSSLGVKSDVFLNTLTGDFYRMDVTGTWTLKGNIKGANGADGTAATVAVGTVTALPYGTAPYVNNTGSSLAAILDFGLMTGQPGSAGSPDNQSQILAKIATPTDGAKLTVQQGATEAGTASKIEVRDAEGNVTNYTSGNGTITVRKGGNTTWVYDTVTQSMVMYRGNGTTAAYRVYSTGKTYANGVWIGGGP